MTQKVTYSETKNRIQECAIELFKQYGYDNVTVVQICEAAGITKRTFYYHYESKEQLVNGITDYLGVKAEHFMDALTSQQTNVGMLWTLMSVYSINSVDYGPSIIRQIYVNAAQGKANEHFPYTMYLYNTVIRTIGNAQKTGEISNMAPPEDVAFALYHCFRSVTMTWAAENGAFDLLQDFRRVFEVVLGVKNVNY